MGFQRFGFMSAEPRIRLATSDHNTVAVCGRLTRNLWELRYAENLDILGIFLCERQSRVKNILMGKTNKITEVKKISNVESESTVYNSTS